MAEKSLILTIGGIFKGDAFKKARAAVVEMNGDIKKGAGAASQLAAAFGGLDASASKSLQAVAGMAQAIATFNVTAIVTQGMMTAINWHYAEMKERAEAAAAAAKELKAAAAAAFSNTLSAQITSVNNEVKNLAADFDSITKQANAFSAALEGVRAASSQGGILKLQTEKLQAMIDAHTDAERQTIESEYNLKIAHAQLIAAEEAGSERITAATEAMETNQKRVANLDTQLAKITEERAHLEETLLIERAGNGKHAADLEKQIATLKQQEIDLERKRNDAAANAEVLELNLQKAKLEAANATEQATQGVKAAQLADTKLREATHAREVAESAAKQAADLAASAKVMDAQETKTAAEIQADVNKAAKDLEAAQREYVDTINKWIDGGGMLFDAIQQNLAAGNKNWTKAGVLDAATQQALVGQVGAFAVDQALAGGAKTVRDLQRAEREGQRRGRDALSQDSGQMTREAKRYERLAKQDRDKLSKADKDFMDKFEKLRNANKEEKKKIADREANIKELATNTKELRKTADEIAKKLDKLGLK